MKMRVWAVLGAIAGSVIAIVWLLSLLAHPPSEKPEVWKTLAKTNMSNGGYCFVRQVSYNVLFHDTAFGYVSSSGVRHSYPLENEGFGWGGVHLVEKEGIIHVRWHDSEAATFNPTSGYFTNSILRHTFDPETGSNGFGSGFFESMSPDKLGQNE